MAMKWTPAKVRARVLVVLAEYPSPVPRSTICNRMPTCCCDAVGWQLSQLEEDGKVFIARTGTGYRNLYSLNRGEEVAAIIKNLWRREPVFTELRAVR